MTVKRMDWLCRLLHLRGNPVLCESLTAEVTMTRSVSRSRCPLPIFFLIVILGVFAGVSANGQSPLPNTAARPALSSPKQKAPTETDGAMVCNGSMTGNIPGNLVVPSGGSCSLSTAVVNGNVRVMRGATFVVGPAGPSTILGNLRADGCMSVMLTGTATITGNIDIARCVAMSGFIGPGITIGGDFRCHENSGPCVANKGLVQGSLLVWNNVSGAPSDVSLDQIGHVLDCYGNAPVPTHLLGPNLPALVPDIEEDDDDQLSAQCTANLGFVVALQPASTQALGPAGGTIASAGGTNLVVPPGALASQAQVTIRPMTTAELEIALQTDIFDGTKFNVLGAVNIDTGGVGFGSPVHLSIPNSTNLPANAQVVVAQISPNLTGNNASDLLLVDTASVYGTSIQDGAPGFPGVTGPGSYAFFNLKTPSVFITGSVQTLAHLPVANALVWNSGTDFVARTNRLGAFTTLVPTVPFNAVFVGANRTRTVFGEVVANTPAVEPVILLDLDRAEVIAATAKAVCEEPIIPSETDLAYIAKRLGEALFSQLTPGLVGLDLSPPSPIVVGQTSTATVDDSALGSFIDTFQTPLHGGIKLRVLGYQLQLGYTFFEGAEATASLPLEACLISKYSTVASVIPNGLPSPFGQGCEMAAPPTFTVRGLDNTFDGGQGAGITDLEGALRSITVKEKVGITIQGIPCPQPILTPAMTVNVSSVAIPVTPLQVLSNSGQITSIARVVYGSPLIDSVPLDQFPRGGSYTALINGVGFTGVSAIDTSDPAVTGSIVSVTDAQVTVKLSSTPVLEGQTASAPIPSVGFSLTGPGGSTIDSGTVTFDIVAGPAPQIVGLTVSNGVTSIQQGVSTTIDLSYNILTAGNLVFGYVGCGNCTTTAGTQTGGPFDISDTTTISVDIPTNSGLTAFTVAIGGVDGAGQGGVTGNDPNSPIVLSFPVTP